MVLRAARVATIPASGQSRSQGNNDSDNAAAYMRYGDGSGVSYAYWHPTRAGDPELQVSGHFRGKDIDTTVRFRFMTLIDENLGKIFGVTKAPSPHATVKMYNYADTYLED